MFELLADFEEVAGWSQPHSHTSHTDLKTCGVCGERCRTPGGERKRTLRTQKGWKAFWLWTRNPLLFLWIQDPVFFFHTVDRHIHTQWKQTESITDYMILGKNVYKGGHPFLEEQGYWATLWTQRGNVQFRKTSLSIELRLYWRGCSPSSDCLSCSVSGLEPLWYLFTYNFSILWASIYMHMNANFSSFWRALV